MLTVNWVPHPKFTIPARGYLILRRRIPRQIVDPFLTATIETWGAPSNIQQRATTQGCEDTSILDQESNTLPD